MCGGVDVCKWRTCFCVEDSQVEILNRRHPHMSSYWVAGDGGASRYGAHTLLRAVAAERPPQTGSHARPPA
eukprot:365222-Chlamydomonas_euryale.AAC.4